MTQGELIEIVASRLGQRSALEPRIRAELRLEQRKMEESPIRPWFLRKRATVVLAATVAVPSDFICEETGIPLVWLDGTPPEALKVGAIGQLQTASAVAGRPEMYVLHDQLYILPAPDADHTAGILFYFARQTFPATDNDTNTWLTHAGALMTAKVGLQMAKFLRSPENVTLFLNDAREALQNLDSLTVARETAAGFWELGG